ncbi:Crp/Fnr family transcriptional regulator [Flavobacteriales bacterium]|nr:Crp/Fnr family transcriptional regulator [Flavobacteriales bacterium]
MEVAELKLMLPFLTEIELLKELLAFSKSKTIEKGEFLIKKGDYIKSLPIILNGSIKISRIDEEGHALFLYYLEKGKTCAMSITCCLSQSKSQIEAEVEEDVELIMIPLAKSEEWMGKYKSWRNFIISSYSNRLDEMLNALDDIAFHQLDERLINYLEKKSEVQGSKEIHITHIKIAQELNSSREAISRLLKRMEKSGDVKLGRNLIELK